MRTEVVSMAAKNTEVIAVNVDKISIHGKEIEDAKRERRQMSETIEQLSRDMADQKRGRSRSIVVIQGEEVPAREPEGECVRGDQGDHTQADKGGDQRE